MKRALLIYTVLIAVSCSVNPDREAVRAYIRDAWDSTLRYNPTDTASLLGMPVPYTVPCTSGMFDELYYWDTFFTNEGLIADGRPELAKNNTEDILSLVDRFGYMPNGNRTWYLSRSQPPFLALMVNSVYEATEDEQWLSRAIPVIEKEYGFWMGERLAPCGLNRYSGSPSDELVEEFITTAGKRLGTDFRSTGLSPEELDKFGRDCVAECESGWDFNPRFDRRCGDFCPVDLNSLLYRTETLMAEFTAMTGDPGKTELWKSRAERRRALMQNLLFDPERDGYFDYDYVNDTRSDVVSAAVFALLFSGAADKAVAEKIKRTLDVLECPSGLSVTEDGNYPYVYQWAYPNAWPPTTYIAVMGLMDYGYRDDALRIAEKYVDAQTECFRRTGQLWEKIRATDGTMPEDREYTTPAMMGWTAGTYVVLDELLKNSK